MLAYDIPPLDSTRACIRLWRIWRDVNLGDLEDVVVGGFRAECQWVVAWDWRGIFQRSDLAGGEAKVSSGGGEQRRDDK